MLAFTFANAHKLYFTDAIKLLPYASFTGQYASGGFLAMMENDRMMSQVMLNWLEKNQGV